MSLSSGKTNYFFERELDYPNQLEFSRQISIYVKSKSMPAGSKREAIAAPDLSVGANQSSCGTLVPRDTDISDDVTAIA
jgi:hypothetical protein